MVKSKVNFDPLGLQCSFVFLTEYLEVYPIYRRVTEDYLEHFETHRYTGRERYSNLEMQLHVIKRTHSSVYVESYINTKWIGETRAVSCNFSKRKFSLKFLAKPAVLPCEIQTYRLRHH